MHPAVNCPRNSKIAWKLGRPSGSWVIDPNNILTVLIHNLKTAWPTKISMPFLSFLGNLLLDACIIFQDGVDNFEIAKHASFGVGAVPL